MADKYVIEQMDAVALRHLANSMGSMDVVTVTTNSQEIAGKIYVAKVDAEKPEYSGW